MKIVVLDAHAVNPGDLSWKRFENLGQISIYERTPADQVIERIGDAQIVLTNKVVLPADVFEAVPTIRWVGILATGYEIVDIKAAREKGVPVCNVADYSTVAVAEMVFALLFELCRRVGAHSDAVMQGEWTSSPDFCFWKYPQSEIYGKTMGIVGLGNIGLQVARIAQAFGMNVAAHSTSRPLPQTDTLRYAKIDELFAAADVLSLHCPLTEQTRGLIGKEAIGKMKPGALVINTARGALVDEHAMADALCSSRIAGFACDVVSVEPMRDDNPLLHAENIIITPHIAWASRQSRQRLIDTMASHLEAFLNGRIEGAVNM